MSAAILAGYEPARRVTAPPVELAATLAELTGARLIVASVQGRHAGHRGRSPAPRCRFAVEPFDDDLIPDCSDAIAELEPELRARHVEFECRVIEGIKRGPARCRGPPRPTTSRCSSSVPASAAPVLGSTGPPPAARRARARSPWLRTPTPASRCAPSPQPSPGWIAP